MIYDDNTPIHFGKHQGTKVKDLPESYLRWVNDQPWPSGVERRTLQFRVYLKSNIERIIENQKKKTP